MHLECFGLSHCMLRSQKQNLVRELWRLRGPNQEGSFDSGLPMGGPEGCNIKSSLNTIMKRLDIDNTESLLEAVKSQGRDHNECVMLPHEAKSNKIHGCSSTSRVACQYWRWPDLKDTDELRKIPSCHSGDGIDGPACINPYHWCRTILIELDHKNGDSLSLGDASVLKRDIYSNTTETETAGSDNEEKNYWCQVAYRELRERIGQLFPVTENAIDIFQDIPQGSGLSLHALHKSHHAQCDQVAKVRTKIGTGITLSDEGDKVWLYNRSMAAIFVSSYSLNGRAQSPYQWRVYKINPGHAIAVYDYVHMREHPPITMGMDGPTDPHSIHISFVKGWGTGYSRQNVISCACWLEVLLHVDR